MSDALAPVPLAGAYAAAAGLSVIAALILLFLDIPRPPIRRGVATGRSLGEIVRRPDFLVAVGCATSAYALMSFVMTAAPLAMTMHHHHQDDAVLGIQWHVLAMFGPSFFTGSLIARFGAHRIVAAGLLLLIGCAVVALSGTAVAHFWAALILLGLGWNFGFIGGTALVTETYRPEEKEKVQAMNDFLLFGIVAVASFSSGEMLLGRRLALGQHRRSAGHGRLPGSAVLADATAVAGRSRPRVRRHSTFMKVR
jgi:di/tricarboxylate transporter